MLNIEGDQCGLKYVGVERQKIKEFQILIEWVSCFQFTQKLDTFEAGYNPCFSPKKY